MYVFSVSLKGIGSFSVSHLEGPADNFYLHIPKRLNANLQAGKKYWVEIHSVEVKRLRYNVHKSSHGAELTVHRTNLELLGLRRTGSLKQQKVVLQFTGTNVTRSNPTSRNHLFRSYELGSASIDLRVGRLGAKYGDMFEFNEITPFEVADLVRAFNEHKPDYLENTSLILRPKALVLLVDAKEIVLARPHLTTNKLEVALRAEIASTSKPIKFQFDGEKITPRFLQDWPIHRMNATPYGLEIAYSLSKNNARVFRLNFEKFDAGVIRGKLKVISRPENGEGVYLVEVADDFRRSVEFRIAAARGRSYYECRYEKGDISEEIQRYLVETTGLWDEVAYHPLDKTWRAHESRKLGPDSLQRHKVSHKLHYFEFKWDWNWELTHHAAEFQAIKYVLAQPTYKGEKVAGAHIGILRWDIEKTRFDFHLSRAWPPSQASTIQSDSLLEGSTSV